MMTTTKSDLRERIARFKEISELLDAVFTEMKELAKKKPDETLNTLKINTINKILEQLREILSVESTVEFLQLLDNETLPSNSDAVLILSQYNAVMKSFRNRYKTWEY